MLGFLCHLNLFPQFLDHELGRKKNLTIYLSRPDIFIVYKNSSHQDRTQLLPFMLKMKTASMCMGSHGSSVGIVTRWKLDDLEFEHWQTQDIYLIFKMSRQALGPNQAPVQWIMICFAGVWPGHEADN